MDIRPATATTLMREMENSKTKKERKKPAEKTHFIGQFKSQFSNYKTRKDNVDFNKPHNKSHRHHLGGLVRKVNTAATARQVNPNPKTAKNINVMLSHATSELHDKITTHSLGPELSTMTRERGLINSPNSSDLIQPGGHSETGSDKTALMRS